MSFGQDKKRPTHEMTVKKQEIDNIPHNSGRFQSLLLRTVHHEVSPESSGLLDVCQSWLEKGRSVKLDVREGSGSTGFPRSMIVLPFVQVMPIISSHVSKENATHVTSPPGAS